MAKDKTKTKAKFKFDIKDPKVRNILVVMAMAGFLGFLWYDYSFRPLNENIAELNEQKDKKESELRTINALKPQLDRLRGETVLATSKLDSLKNIFPDQKEVPRLIREITAVNRKSNVATTRFLPLPDVEQEYYIENKYNVTVAGDYHNLGEFFSYLANFQLIINLSGVTVSANPGFTKANPESPVKEEAPSILASFELTTFSSRH
ncbi:MAG: type 4a pilus biogenesis protein PilO [Chitinispirillales bacterium]|jgi:type IV pilus assembly protein PilO|nr:type 4a pilus biogenesis protein PilO [Chitinispirillales bacterium]